jgi:outer membrane protein
MPQQIARHLTALPFQRSVCNRLLVAAVLASFPTISSPLWAQSVVASASVVSATAAPTTTPAPTTASVPENLLTLLRKAQSFDATYLAAQAQFEAAQYKAEQSKALWRPNVTSEITHSQSVNDTPFNPTSTRSEATTTTGSLSLQQSLFNQANRATRSQADKVLEIAQYELTLAEHDLMMRCAQAYFDLLAAKDALSTVQASKSAITEQLTLAQRSFEVGTATIVDTREAQARLALVTAQELAANNELRNRQAALDALIGGASVNPAPIKTDAAHFPDAPTTALAEMVSQARTLHPGVRISEIAAEVASLETDKARAGHLPTLSLAGKFSKGPTDIQSHTRASALPKLEGDAATQYIGLSLNFPIFTGMSAQNRIHETLALQDKAQLDLQATQRKIELDLTQAYLGLKSLESQVAALRSAENASKVALEAVQLGYKVGVRVNLDVLNAQSQLFQTQRDLAKAQYDFLLGQLKLRRAAGSLNIQDVTELTQVLQ